jgi:hypothetical protein
VDVESRSSCTMEEGAAQQKSKFFDVWESQLRKEFTDIMGEVEDTECGKPRAKYLNWNHYFAVRFPETDEGKANLAALVVSMEDLFKKVHVSAVPVNSFGMSNPEWGASQGKCIGQFRFRSLGGRWFRTEPS